MILCKPIVLSGYGVRLEPLNANHADGLRSAAADGELWTLRVTSVPEPDKVYAYIATALQGQVDGHRQPWAAIDESSARVIGCTSYHDIMAEVDRVEIGYTWYAKSVQRSYVNTACKLLLMTHAFETLGCKVVGWRTDILNFASQRAIERLGAKRDGVIRHHALRRDSTIRDTVIYSMLLSEWSDAKSKLINRLSLATTATANSTSIASPAKVTLTEVSQANYLDLLRLVPGAVGERMVAPVAKSIVQAEYSPNARMWAIEANQSIVGFVMVFDPTIAAQDTEPNDVLYVWRLMIDFSQQGKGYGEQTIAQIKKLAAQLPGIKFVRLSHQQHEGNPGPFYLQQGFTYTGNIEHDELEMQYLIQ